MEMTSEMIQTIFAAIIVAAAISTSLTHFVKPTFETYGNAQARLLSKNIGSTIDAFSGIEEGRVEIDMGLTWDIRIRCNDECEVKVSHDKFDGGKEILTNVDELNLIGVSKVIIEKKDDVIKVMGG